jgi:hypothetical protein
LPNVDEVSGHLAGEYVSSSHRRYARERSLAKMKESETSSQILEHHYDESPANTESSGEKTGIRTEVQSEVGKLRDAAREQSSVAMDQIKRTAQSALQNAQEAGQSFVHDQKDSIANRLSDYAKAAHTVSEKLRAEGDNILANPAEKAAGSLDRISGYLREKQPLELLDDLESLARRKPELFFGGLFVAGFAAARFFKASRRQSSAAQSPSRAQNEPWTSAGAATPAPGYPSPEPGGGISSPPLQAGTQPRQMEATPS